MSHLTAEEYSEIFCEAMNQMLKASLEGLPYDITKQCTIIDDSNKKDGLYVVTDGSVKFEAYSTSEEYRKGTVVYVTIPNGDFNMQKIITGKQVGTNSTPFTFTAPLDTLIAIDNNSLFEGDFSILANGNDRIKTVSQEDVDYTGFTRLGISADFKSWLAPMDTISGTYGIKVFLTCIENDLSTAATREVIRELTLSSNDMYGNPYGFETFFTQEKVFDISTITRIKNVRVALYQLSDFKDGIGANIAHTDDFGVLLPDNIFVNNIKLYIGYDQEQFTEDTLMIYTDNSLSYSNRSADAAANTKIVKLRWIHKDLETGKFSLLTESSLNENLELRWYRYNLGESAADEYSGVYWTHLTDFKNKLSCTITPDIKLGTEQIRAIGLVKQTEGELTPYYSATITFTNDSPVIDEMTVQATKGLMIQCMDNSEGNYFIYDQNGKLEDESNGSAHIRTLQLFFDNGAVNSGLNESGISSIEWFFPMENSMILLNPSFYSKAQLPAGASTPERWTQDGKEYYHIRYIPNKVTGESIASNLNSYKHFYTIRDNWTADYSNNTIICKVTVDEREYVAQHELRFGKAGTVGTDMTLVLNIENNVSAVTIGDNIEVAAYVYDSAGKIVNLNDYKDNLSWTWKADATGLETYLTISALTESGRAKITCPTGLSNDNLKLNFHILQCTLSDYAKTASGGDIDLIAYLPIPIRRNNTYSYISGTREIVYDPQGNPDYHKKPYALYYWNSNEEYDTAQCEWGMSYLSLGLAEGSPAYMPRLKETLNGPKLVASTFYLKDANDCACVFAEDSAKNILWSQPILIIQNQYAMPMLNSWDGELTYDKENGTILSKMLGAGKKTSNNTFSGVLIGDVRKASGISKTGVYGYQEGVNSFALLEDGTATFGAAGRGQIHIDGTKGTIKSADFDVSKIGMKMDLDDGILILQDQSTGYVYEPTPVLVTKDTYKNYYVLASDYNSYQFAVKGESFVPIQVYGYMPASKMDNFIQELTYYDQNETAINSKSKIELNMHSPYLTIDSISGNRLLQVGTNDYFLQSNGYDRFKKKGGYGTKFDLEAGTLDIKNVGGLISLSGKNDPYFKVAATVNLDDGTSTKDVDLVYMGQNNYYLQSVNYDPVTIVQVTSNSIVYYIYQTADSKYIAVPKGNDALPIYEASLSGNTYTISTTQVSYPTSYTREKTYVDADGNIVGTGTYETISYVNPRQTYINTLTPVLTSSTSAGSGMFIDLNSGVITGYDLYLRGINKSEPSQSIVIDSGNPSTPFSIGNNFRVAWNGTLTCQKVNYLGTVTNTGEYVINIGNNFKVSPSGGVSGTSGHFGGGWFGGSAAIANQVQVGAGSWSSSIAGLSGNKIVNTGASPNSILSSANSSLKSAIKDHKHYVYGKTYTFLTGVSVSVGNGGYTEYSTPSITNLRHRHQVSISVTPSTAQVVGITTAAAGNEWSTSGGGDITVSGGGGGGGGGKDTVVMPF